jgi:hypothetical protein
MPGSNSDDNIKPDFVGGLDWSNLTHGGASDPLL